MPYISSNGEVYEDEEIFSSINEESDDFIEFEFLPADELVLRWEQKLHM